MQPSEWPPAPIDFHRFRGDIKRLLAETATEPTVEKSLFVRDRDQNLWVVLESFIRNIDPAAHKSWRGLQEKSAVNTLLVAAADAERFLTAYDGLGK